MSGEGVSGRQTVTLDRIPRYTSITSFTVSKRNETSVTYNFTTADTCDYAWYSVNNGSSWTGVDITDGTSASFNVGSLSPNTTYNFKVRVRRKDSQLTTDSSTVSQTTYKIPTQAFSSKTETRVTMTWSIDTTADYIWYSTNNGSSWTAVGSVNATSGSYNITGLSPNTAYNIKTRVRRKAPQTTYNTTALSVTTYKAPTHSLSSKTETTANISWTADSTVDYIWYSTNNGSSWTGVDVTDGTSGTYSISGLTANTTYQVKTRFRRKATQTNYDVGPLSVTTYDYPYVSAVGTSALTIGNNQTLTLYNPLSRSVAVKMYQNNTSGTELYSGTTSGTSITFTPTANTLYASIPNSSEAYCVYSIVYGSSRKTTVANTYKYKIAGTEVPTFGDFTYADTNSTTTALTGDSHILINGYSNVTATVSVANKAIANNSATMRNYVLSIGGQSAQANYSDDSDVTLPISKVTNNSIKVTANDSRGLGTSVTKTATIKNYIKPATTSLTATRSSNGVGEEVTLAFEGTWWNDSFGLQTNAIQNIQYYFKKSDAQTWTTGSTTITFTTNQNTFSGSLVVYGDTETHGFDITSSYFIKIVVTDKLDYSEDYQTTIGSGTPAIAIYKDNVAIGQQYDTSEESKLQVNGAINIPNSDAGGKIKADGKTILRITSDNKTVLSSGSATMYFRPNGSGTNTGELTLSTDGKMTVNGDIMQNGTPQNTQFSGHFFHSYFPSTSQVYEHFYPLSQHGTQSTTTSTANLRVWDGTNKTFKAFTISGNGNVAWGGQISSSIKIPNSNASGKGLLNANGSPIIQDYNNNNVVVNATGGGLYLGYANTTSINILKGKATIDSNGNYSGNSANVTQKITASSKTHTNYNNNQGYVPAMSFLTYWNGAYNSSNSSNLTYAHQGTIQCKPTNLYNNTSGTTGTITLSQTAANFNYIEVHYLKYEGNLSYSVYGSTKIYAPNGKRAVDSFNFSYTSGAQTQLINRTIYFNGTSLTQSYGTVFNVVNSGINGHGKNNTEVKIVRVDGWK